MTGSVGLRLAAAAALAAALPVGAAAATPRRVPNWAGREIAVVLTHGLMGGPRLVDFHANNPLTRQSLANLAFGLEQVLAPPPVEQPAEPAPVPVDPASTDPATAEPATTDPTTTHPTTTDPTTTDPTTTDPTTTDPTTTDPTTTDPTTTEPAPAPAPPAPAVPPRVSLPSAKVSMAVLDARLVGLLGLSGAASEFAKGAMAAGLKVPWRFGTEVTARLLGLRTNHPAAQDFLELLPNDPATRAEAAYSAAQILDFGWLGNSWETAAAQSLADSFALPQLTAWQRRILQVAVSKIGMPYIWGGTSDGPEAPFGVQSRGGYDCSGFVWRVYKLQRYPEEGSLASTLRGRTTFEMSVEVPAAERIPFADLQPADVIFFGAHGPDSSAAEVDHMGIYLGNGWFIQSSGYGVALAQLAGGYRKEFAWGRRPLLEAGLES
jgi:cell wall-associated NlpC family hydrolase